LYHVTLENAYNMELARIYTDEFWNINDKQ
jgi:hypothetical protein